jgi:hypothetical protein
MNDIIDQQGENTIIGMRGAKGKVISKHYKANFSLGGTIKNITPQIFVTHPTSRQHRTHIKKKFHSKLFIKRLPKSCRIQNSN